MPTPQRLPIVNNDDGTWGDIIRQYLAKEHYNDDTDNAANGGHQKVTLRPGTTLPGSAPLKFTPGGGILDTAEEGALEYSSGIGTLFFTTGGPTRKTVAIYNDSSGNTGDTYYRNSYGEFVSLGIGADGKTLRVASGLPAWSDPTFTTGTHTSSYSVSATEVVTFADATSSSVTVTLPAASGLAGYRFFIKRIDSSANTCTVARSGSDTIDGQTSISLNLQYTCMTVVSNGTAWYII